MLSKSFKPAKCKTSLKLAVSRIKLLRNKRDIQIKQMRRELALLIENGQEQTARIRVEHVIREERTSAAYELIELFCELLAARMPIIESQKHCPVDLKEPVATVIFASPRCSDIPELMEIRKHFAAKYGKEFTSAALEIRPDCGVSRLVIEKLSARAPDIETKIKTLKAIAEDHNVKWDSKSFEDLLQKPHEDLLNGPTSFAGATKHHTEQHTVNPSPGPYPTQTNVSSINMFQTPKESTTSGGEVNYPNSGNADFSSRNQTAYNLEFQNATSAAQAAAESAERASIAARAAARFASHENMSRQTSTLSNETPKYDSKYDKPENLRVFLDGYNSFKEPAAPVNYEQKSKQEVKPVVQNPYMHEQIQRNPSNHFPSNSSPAPSMNYELKSSQDVKSKSQNPHVHEHIQRNPNHFSSNSSPAPSMNYELKRSQEVEPRGQHPHVHEQIQRNPSNYYSANSSLDFVDDGMLNANFQKQNSNNVHIESNSSRSKTEDPSPRTSKYDYASIKYADDVYLSTMDSFYNVAKDKDVLNSDITDHENNEEEAVRRGASIKQSSFSDSPAAVFDNYVDEGSSSSVWRNNETLFDNHPEEEASNYHASTSFNGKTSAGSFAKPSSSRLNLFTEPHEEEHSLPSPANVSPTPAFDASDDESTASPVNFLRKSSIKSSYSDDKSDIPNQTYIGETKEVAKNDSRLYERKIEADPIRVNKYNFSSSDEEEPLPLTQRVTKILPKEKPKSSESLENLSEEKQGINFGLLTGGLKHKSLPLPPYVKSYASSVSDSPIAKEHESSPKAYASKTKHSYLDSLESDDDEHLPSPTQQKKVYREVNSNPLAYSDSDDEKQYPSTADTRKYNTSNRVNANVKHSRRTRDVLPTTHNTYPKAAASKPEKPAFEESSKPKQVQTTHEESSKSLSVESVKSTGSVSSEGSVKKASHVHPKLPPDYDTFAAHFHALRSNKR